MLQSLFSLFLIFTIGFVFFWFVLCPKISSLRAWQSHTLSSLYRFVKTHPVFFFLSRLILPNKPPSNLPVVTHFEKVSSRCYRILGQNPGFHTLQGTNTYLITGIAGTTEHILVDTGELATSTKFLSVLFDEVFPITKTTRLSAIVLTHGHGDHQGGVLPLLTALQQHQMLPLPIIYKKEVHNGKYPCEGFTSQPVANNHIFEIDSQTTLQVIDTPGHTDDHIALYLIQDKAILTGDCVLGCGTTVFDDLYEYMKSLVLLKELIIKSTNNNSNDSAQGLGSPSGEICHLYPGHGPVIYNDALAKIEEYIHHREKRDEQIIQALNLVDPQLPYGKRRALTSIELVPLVYGNLPMGVFFSAQANLRHHLKKLVKEGKIVRKHGDTWKAKEIMLNKKED